MKSWAAADQKGLNCQTASEADDLASVRELQVSPGLQLVLSRFSEGTAHQFKHSEPEDVVAVALHLKGGAEFAMESARMSTAPFDILACGLPRGTSSVFRFPSSGFETVALRMVPSILLEEGFGGRRIADPLRLLANSAVDEVAVDKLGRASPSMLLVARAMLAASKGTAGDELFLSSCALAMLASLDDCPGPEAMKAEQCALPKAKLERARDLLEENFARPPTIYALARAVGTNEFALKRGFKQAFGTTIHAYVRRYRMDLAAERLDGGAAVQDAASAVGYECPRCFAEAFRRTFGVLPSSMTRRDRAIAPADHG